MYDPDLYDSFSEFQRRDATELLPYMVSKMEYKPNEKILDFGCGSGFNTRNILLPNLENLFIDDTRTIYGIDISKKMIDFASVKYKHDNITYMVADIMKEECEFPCKFGKIISLHVLHWIPDLGKALQILYSLLNDNGEIGFYFIGNAAVFSVYERMSNDPVWAPYLTDVKSFIPKTFYSADPAKDVSTLMHDIGFQVQEATVLTRSYKFSTVQEMTDTAMAANPFIHRIPTELQNDYKTDFQSNFTTLLKSNPALVKQCGQVEVPYQLIYVTAQKLGSMDSIITSMT